MKHIWVLSVIFGLAGCAPLNIYHKTGVTVAKMQSDQLACEVEALRQAPQANALRRDPPEFVPGVAICDDNGDCAVSPGFFIPGAVYTVDENQDLRDRLTQQCMADQGYVPKRIKYCPSGTPLPQTVMSKLPEITDETCAIRLGDQKWQIITPAP